MIKEIWKDIDELNQDYQVSNLGRIKSKARIVEFPYRDTIRRRKISEKILKPTIKKTGDRVDSVQFRIRDKDFSISLLVYFYFISEEPIPKGFCVAHKNKNPIDNRAENLILCTWSNSRKIDHSNSTRTKIWQQERSRRGANAMKRKAFLKQIKFINPNDYKRRTKSRSKPADFHSDQ